MTRRPDGRGPARAEAGGSRRGCVVAVTTPLLVVPSTITVSPALRSARVMVLSTVTVVDEQVVTV